jgi:hypothetical protein
MTTAQLSQFAGWVQGSKMPPTYMHLSGKDILAPRLSMYGITVKSAQSEREVRLKIMKLGQAYLKDALILSKKVKSPVSEVTQRK